MSHLVSLEDYLAIQDVIAEEEIGLQIDEVLCDCPYCARLAGELDATLSIRRDFTEVCGRMGKITFSVDEILRMLDMRLRSYDDEMMEGEDG